MVKEKTSQVWVKNEAGFRTIIEQRRGKHYICCIGSTDIYSLFTTYWYSGDKNTSSHKMSTVKLSPTKKYIGTGALVIMYRFTVWLRSLIRNKLYIGCWITFTQRLFFDISINRVIVFLLSNKCYEHLLVQIMRYTYIIFRVVVNEYSYLTPQIKWLIGLSLPLADSFNYHLPFFYWNVQLLVYFLLMMVVF